jgi:hypothetical protein
MELERPASEEEYKPLNQPERIDKAQQNLWDIKQQIEPVGINNKEEIKSALIALDFMLADAYNEVMERQVFPLDELAEKTYQQALRTLERYIQQHKKEPDSDVDADFSGATNFSN